MSCRLGSWIRREINASKGLTNVSKLKSWKSIWNWSPGMRDLDDKENLGYECSRVQR